MPLYEYTAHLNGSSLLYIVHWELVDLSGSTTYDERV